MHNEILMGTKAKEKLLKGVQALCDAVKVTLGPSGKNVILEQGSIPLITNDGYTIAKNIKLEDKFENLGAKLIFEASSKTNEIAGDGTTTACVLTEALINEGLRNVRFGVNPIELGIGMKKACEFIVSELAKQARKVESNKDIKQVATISCQDEEIGSLIAKAFEIVGNDGVITLEESNKLITTLEVVEGLRFDKGYVSSYFCTNSEKQVCEMDNPYILITDQKIENINQILSILEQTAQGGKKLVIIATDFAEEVVATLVMNKLRGSINVNLIKSPAFGEQRNEVLEDLCICVGANLISNEKNLTLENASLEDLGQCKKIISTRENTTILEGCGDKEEIEKRIVMIKENKKNCDDEYEKNVFMERLTKMQNGVAIIKVGGATDIECNERKLRIEDALSATKSAIEEGIVIGGGCALIKCIDALNNEIENNYFNTQKIGASIVLKSLESPLRQIAKNCGQDDGVVVDKVKNNKNTSYGFNALTNEFCNLEECGIIDPKKVTRTALQNAVSVSSSLLTTEYAIIDKD